MPDRPVRVAYLSYDGLTDPLGQSQILPYVLGLEANGFEFVIFSFEKPEAFKVGQGNINVLIKEKKISWIPLAYHKNPPVLSTVFDVYLLWKEVSFEHKRKPFHILHCRSYITALVGLRMKRKKGVKFIFDMRGFWADERVEGGLWNLNNPLFQLVYHYFKQKEKRFLAEADHIISLTENAKQEILSWRLRAAPITVIPTCVDLELFNPEKIIKEDQQALRAKLRIKQTDFVLLYLGSWGTWYLTKEMLAFFTELRKQKSNARFLIVTNDKIELKDFTYWNDVVITSAPHHLVPLHISLANASVLFIKPSFSKKASSATKMGEILAMNVPVVTNTGWGDVDEYTGKGVYLLEGMRHQINCREEMFSIPSNEKLQSVIENLSLVNGIQLYKMIYEKIL